MHDANEKDEVKQKQKPLSSPESVKAQSDGWGGCGKELKGSHPRTGRVLGVMSFSSRQVMSTA